MFSEWQLAVAQADFADWVTVAAYLLAAAACWRASGHAWIKRHTRDRIFWQVVSGLLVFLGINELLDLQALLTSVGREHAKANGWYGEHRSVQYVFVLALGAAAILAGIVMLWHTRRTDASVRVALVGLVFIGLFVLLRAASFHHFDELLGGGAPEFNWGSMQEMLGILIVAGGALAYTRKRRSRGKAARR